MWVYICRPIGDVAQLVEQRIENPCVGGSIPSITTQKPFGMPKGFFMPENHVLNRYTFHKFCPCDNHKKDGLLL